MFLRLRNLGNICCGHKMFLNKIRNIFCVRKKCCARGQTGKHLCRQQCVPASFARAFKIKCFPSTLKTQGSQDSVFKLLRFEERFREAPFSMVNFSGLEWTVGSFLEIKLHVVFCLASTVSKRAMCLECTRWLPVEVCQKELKGEVKKE